MPEETNVSPRGSIERTGIIKLGKGAAVGGIGAVIVGVLIELGVLPKSMQGPQTIAALTFIAGVLVNLARKLVTKYEIEL